MPNPIFPLAKTSFDWYTLSLIFSIFNLIGSLISFRLSILYKKTELTVGLLVSFISISNNCGLIAF